jgi:hypothetical protein
MTTLQHLMLAFVEAKTAREREIARAAVNALLYME